MRRLWLGTATLVMMLTQMMAGAVSAWADDDAGGAKLLPRETLAFFSIPDAATFRQEFDESQTGSILREPEMKPFLEDVKKKLEQLSTKLQEEVGVSLDDLLGLMQGEVTVAVIDQPDGKLGVAFLLDYGESKDTVAKLLKKMHEALEKEDAEHSKQEIEKVEVHVYALKNDDPNNPFKSLAYFNQDDYLVIGSDVGLLKSILERWDGDSDDTLATSDSFKYVMERCRDGDNDPNAQWFVNPIGIVKAGLRMAQASNPQVGLAGAFLPMLGLDRLEGVGGAMYSNSGDFESVSKTFVLADQPTGLLNLFQFPATELAPPKWVAGTASMYFGANWNPDTAYRAVETLVDSFQGRGALARLMDQAADSGPQIHPKQDVIDQLSGRIHVVQGTDKPGENKNDDELAVPKFFVALGLKDAGTMKKTLAKIAKAEDSQMEAREFNGETIYEMEAGEGRTIAAAVVEGQLVITSEAKMLEAMIRPGDGASLAESPAYRKISKHFPAKSSMISYQNSDAQMRAYYETLKSGNNFDFEWLDGIDFSKLPPFEVLEKYLVSSGSYTVPDKKGALTVGFSLSEEKK